MTSVDSLIYMYIYHVEGCCQCNFLLDEVNQVIIFIINNTLIYLNDLKNLRTYGIS